MPNKGDTWKIQDTFLNKMRIRRNLTIRELSDKLQAKASTVGKWCAGISVPRTKSIVKLADILNVEYDYLLDHCKEDNENYKKHAKGAKRKTHNKEAEPNNEVKEEKPNDICNLPKNVHIEIRFQTDKDVKYDEIYNDIYNYIKSNFNNSNIFRMSLNIDGWCFK